MLTSCNTFDHCIARGYESPAPTVPHCQANWSLSGCWTLNLGGGLGYNTLCLPIAAGVLYPVTGMLLSPMIAGAAMSLSSITVVSNANRLRLFKARNETGPAGRQTPTEPGRKEVMS
jgi:hypothetical protein